ncbi:MAG: DUF5050 domain-containing protein [candidate division WOR-3 bacterium]
MRLFFIFVITLLLLSQGIAGWVTKAYTPILNTDRIATTRVSSDTIYAWIGPKNSSSIQRYRTNTNQWVSALQLPGALRSKSASMVWDNASQKVFISNVKLTDAPSFIGIQRPQGTLLTNLRRPPKRLNSPNDMVCVSRNDTSYIFALRKANTKNLYRYTIPADTWIPMTDLPEKVKGGAAICWDGDGDGYLYALRGKVSAESCSDFCRYSLSSNDWDGLSDLVEEILGGKKVNCGALAYRPEPEKQNSDEIYAFVRKNERKFLRYSVDDETWTFCDSTLYDIKEGASLIYIPTKDTIYAIRGKGTNEFWAYGPSSFDFENPGKGLMVNSTDFNETDDENGDPQNPGWSRTGEWVIFSKIDNTGFYQIYKRRPDGSEESAITSDSSNFTEPKWAPDSDYIACIIDDKLGLMKSDGSGKRILDDGICSHPSWSPDGNWVTYVKWSFTDQYHKIYKIRRDGSEQTCLTNAGTNFFPKFSSDLNFVVYQKDECLLGQIYKVDISSGLEEKLSNREVDYGTPQWSPVVDTIIFVAQDSDGFYQIYKMGASGGEEILLTNGQFDYLQPQFSPSGENIVYVKSHPDSAGTQICRKSVHGGEEIQLTDYSTLKTDPEWSPAGDLIVYIESDTASKAHKNVTVIPAFPTAIDEHFGFSISNFNLAPNPFSRNLSISFALTLLGQIKKLDNLNFRIYDINGRMVRTLKPNRIEGDKVLFIWNGKDDSEQELPYGVYFLNFQAGKTKILRKVTLFKN